MSIIKLSTATIILAITHTSTWSIGLVQSSLCLNGGISSICAYDTNFSHSNPQHNITAETKATENFIFERDFMVPGYGSAGASATASFGSLKAWASSSCAGSNCLTAADASAKFEDIIIIEHSELTGQRGLMHINIDYSWFFSNSNETRKIYIDSDYYFIAESATSNTFVLKFRANTYDNIGVFAGGYIPEHNYFSYISLNSTIEKWEKSTPPFGRTQISVPFVFGKQIPIFMQLDAGATTSLPAVYSFHEASLNASALTDASQSAYWGGAFVSLEDGTIINDFNLSSASGTDWRQSFTPTPIPEPNAIALIASGLLLVLLKNKFTKDNSRLKPKI